MSMLDMSLGEFSAALASSSAVPGGGGASALCAAVAAALGSMVGNISIGKAGCADVEAELKSLTERSELLRAELLELVDRDAQAFSPLAKAYSIPKDAPERETVMEDCLAAAAAVPMRILELCCQDIELMEGFAAYGSKALISDAGTGAVLAWGAMYASALNVLVNTKEMKNRDLAEKMNARVDELMNQYWQRADKTYEDIFQKLR